MKLDNTSLQVLVVVEAVVMRSCLAMVCRCGISRPFSTHSCSTGCRRRSRRPSVEVALANLRTRFGEWTGPSPTYDELRRSRRELWEGYVEPEGEGGE